MQRHIHGIYGILPENLEDEMMLQMAEAALKGGVRLLQLRDKKMGFKQKLRRAKRLRELTHRFEALMMVNDSWQLALDADADGVHLGRSDMKSVASIRAEAGDELIIGVSCQGDAAFARYVLNEGCDYVSFGAVFPTQSKAGVVPIGLPRLAKARQLFPKANICAIGGITPEALPAIKKAGADCAAVISSLFAVNNIEARARKMVGLWEQD